MHYQDLDEIGRKLAGYRKAQNLTQSDVGRLVSIDRQTISAIENCRFSGSLAILMRYLHYAGMTLTTTEKPSPFPELDSLKDRYGEDDD